MLDVELRTESGDLIGYFSIPPFDVLPAVLLWNDRVFKWSRQRNVYVEVFSYTVVSPRKEVPRALDS